MSSISSITSSDPMSSPARIQVDINTLQDEEKPQQVGGATFNMWYLNWSGGGGINPSASDSFTRSKFRVNIERDQGYTRAGDASPVCLFFSRGCCYMGSNCKYSHSLPSKSKFQSQAKDCFGRDKTAEYNDDMDGVGSFNHTNKTLYIGGIQMRPNIEDLVTKNFEEFGDIAKVKVIYNKNCAFVTMKTEFDAQFAKEAMNRQCLINPETNSSKSKEVLHVRWAHQDRNPEAQKQNKRKTEQMAMDTVKELLSNETCKRVKMGEGREIDNLPSEVVDVELDNGNDDDNDDEDDDDDDDDVDIDESDDEDEEDDAVPDIKPKKNGKLHRGKMLIKNKNTTNQNGALSRYSESPNYGHANGQTQNGHGQQYRGGGYASTSGGATSDEIRRDFFERHGLANQSTLKDLAELRKRMKTTRHEPNLVTVLGNYSSDEDDD
ncbi:CWC2 [Candida theae]|uniref:Pre-mRNA-splicing factor CWC2 n=1 Tax=Candida theae TaxID=1198502 RepID=A0AAD5BEP9_9ASCO|nr:CWC2 [Candida theae]KAI5958009.1 CWC2 [Candida theae]